VAAALAAQVRSWRYRVWALLLTIVAVVLCFFPLFNLLGLGFALVMGFLSSVASMDLGAAQWRRLRNSKSLHSPGRTYFELGIGVTLLNLALLLVPILVVSMNGLRVRNCDWIYGFKAYFAIPVLGVVFATALGLVLGCAAGARRRLSLALPWIAVVVLVLHSLWRFYAAPPVFSYNPLIGFFPGSLYDENIQFNGPFRWARLTHISAVWTLWLWCCVAFDANTNRMRWTRVRRRSLMVAAAGLLSIWSLVLLSLGGSLGFRIDENDIFTYLSETRETDHFVIHYSEGSKIAKDIDLIAADHEFRLAQVVDTLGAKMPTEKIHSFYFRSASDKFEWMGAGNVYMAKPWRNEIYIHHMPFPHHVLRHEIAHVVAAQFGSPIFGVSAQSIAGLPLLFNVGLIEGLAVAADWPDHFIRPMTPHENVKAMYRMSMAPPIDRVLSLDFLSFSNARSYTTAGSFVRFLLDKYGPEKLQSLYRSGGDFSAAYGRSGHELGKEWQDFISAIELPEKKDDVVRERFRRRGIFHRPCPHHVARARYEAVNLAARGRHKDAIAVWQRICDQVPQEPAYQLELARLLIRGKDRDRALEVLEALVADPGLSSSLRINAAVDMVKIHVQRNDVAAAIDLLEEVSDEEVSDDLKRNMQAQLMVLSSDDPAHVELRAYFWGDDDDEVFNRTAMMGAVARALIADSDNAFAHYLLGRNLSDASVAMMATEHLEKALQLGLPLPLLQRECARLLAQVSFRAGAYDVTERAARILIKEDQGSVLRLYGLDWLERVAWTQSGALPSPRPTLGSAR
jgi:tetratricopeptide (TPR) repeat protein